MSAQAITIDLTSVQRSITSAAVIHQVARTKQNKDRKAQYTGRYSDRATNNAGYHTDPLFAREIAVPGPITGDDAGRHLGFWQALVAFNAIFKAEKVGVSVAVEVLQQTQTQMSTDTNKLFQYEQKLIAIQKKLKSEQSGMKWMQYVEIGLMVTMAIGALALGPEASIAILLTMGAQLSLTYIKVPDDGKSVSLGTYLADKMTGEFHGKTKQWMEGLVKFSISLVIGLAAGVLTGGALALMTISEDASESLMTTAMNSAKGIFTSSAEDAGEDTEMTTVSDSESSEAASSTSIDALADDDEGINEIEVEIQDGTQANEEIAEDQKGAENAKKEGDNDGTKAKKMTKKQLFIRSGLVAFTTASNLWTGWKSAGTIGGKDGDKGEQLGGFEDLIDVSHFARKHAWIGAVSSGLLTIATNLTLLGGAYAVGGEASFLGSGRMQTILNALMIAQPAADGTVGIIQGSWSIKEGEVERDNARLTAQLSESNKQLAVYQTIETPLANMIRSYVSDNAYAMQAAVTIINNASQALNPIIQA